jgi:hypothetical protein
MEVGLWLTGSTVVEWDFFLTGVWQGLSLGGEEKKLDVNSLHFKHWCYLLRYPVKASQTHTYYSGAWM